MYIQVDRRLDRLRDKVSQYEHEHERNFERVSKTNC